MDTSKYIAEFKQLEADLSSGSLSSTELAQKSKRHAFLRPIIEKEQELNAVEKAIADDRAMIEAGEDKELVKMAADELAELEAKLPVLQKSCACWLFRRTRMTLKIFIWKSAPVPGGTNPPCLPTNCCAFTSTLRKPKAGRPKFWNLRPPA